MDNIIVITYIQHMYIVYIMKLVPSAYMSGTACLSWDSVYAYRESWDIHNSDILGYPRIASMVPTTMYMHVLNVVCNELVAYCYMI